MAQESAGGAGVEEWWRRPASDWDDGEAHNGHQVIRSYRPNDLVRCSIFVEPGSVEPYQPTWHILLCRPPGACAVERCACAGERLLACGAAIVAEVRPRSCLHASSFSVCAMLCIVLISGQLFSFEHNGDVEGFSSPHCLIPQPWKLRNYVLNHGT